MTDISVQDTLSMVSTAIPVLVGVLTISPLWTLITSFRRTKATPDDALYQDKDGVATEESMAAYSTTRQFILIFIGTGLGLAASFSLAVFATVRFMHLNVLSVWNLNLSWVFILLQVLGVFREKRIVPRYQRGVTSAISVLLVAVLAGIVIASESIPYPGQLALTITLAVQMVSAIVVSITFLSIHRRPDVFTASGKLVERQNQTSLWTRYSYNWSSELLDLAATKLIEISDLPALDSHIRAKDVKESFRSIVLKPTVPLWLQIFWTYRSPISFQWVMVILSSVIDVAPQFAMLRLLQFLEARQGFDMIDPIAWFYVGSLFLATVVETLVDYRVSWLMWSDIGIPIRSTLTTLLFEKMMKTKDCKEPPKSANEKIKADNKLNGDANGKPADGPKPSTGDDAKKEAEKKKKTGQSEQDVINMFAVDCNQVGVFGAINQFYVMFASKTIVSLVFLLLLVGWESLAAGLIPIILVFPLNKLLATRYGKLQKLLMAARDKKTKVISEALQGIRQIKFSANEPEWTEKINRVREDELVLLWKAKLNNLYMTFSGDIAPAFLTVFALATYSYIHGDLLPSVAFTALGLFMSLEGILGMVPFLFMIGMNAKVSCDRIDTFLKSAEKPENTYPGEAICFENASISFPSKLGDVKEGEEDEEDGEARQNRFTIRDLTLQFPNNALTIITGPTGSGKSLLLAAILGEVDVISGNITVPRPPPVGERFDSKATAANWLIPNAIAFVSQIPWIENASIKDNILFGLPFDEDRYNRVLKACSLTQDLEIFTDGDLTEVGAQGISLSGGQKWRLTMARALYSRAGILILDDIFSAVDAHVGRELYDNALMGELAQGRTRVLVTHHIALCLPGAEYVVHLSSKGTVEHAGRVKDLEPTSSFHDMIEAENDKSVSKDQIEQASKAGQNRQANGSTVTAPKPPPKKLVEDEARESGSVKRSVYMAYLKATGGFPFWTFVLVFYVIAQGLTLSRSWWIKIWTSSYEHAAGFHLTADSYSIQMQLTNINTSTLTDPTLYDSVRSGAANSFIGSSISQFYSVIASSGLPGTFTGMSATYEFALSDHPASLNVQAQGASSVTNLPSFPIDVNNRELVFYLVGYIIISFVSTFIDVGRYYVVYRGSLAASRKVFRDMCFRVLRTPLRWLDTVPTGRILNRFTADFALVDSQLSSDFAQVGASVLAILGIMVAALTVSPYVIILALLLMVICSRIALRYIRGARSIKRLESICKSPMISHFTSALQGLSTIRAFANTEVFETRMNDLIDSFNSATWHNWLFNNWVNFRMAMMGSIFSTVVAAFIVGTRGIDASLAGFALAFAMGFRRTVQSTLRFLASTELDMNAAERIFEYSALDIESQDGADVRASWPEKGELEVNDLVVGYAVDLPPILKGLSFHAESNQRIGIVGRTGAGKSTLSLAIFRFLQAREGSIVIDGVDISKIKLHDLRTRLAIIPQDPVLFSGTIRSNLDPFDQFSDNELREALQRVHLIPSTDITPNPEAEDPASSSSSITAIPTQENTNIFLSLSSPISASGGNLSQGQKQLLCLARAILSRPKLLLLDEATSAVDKETDRLIQRSIREEFNNTTLLVIAHRLSTVMDFDRILVMKDGKTVEFGSPAELGTIEGGVWRGMVDDSGEGFVG